MSDKTPVSKETVREALETVRDTLSQGQLQARTAVVALYAASGVIKSLDASLMQMVALDADFEQRLSAVNGALDRLDSVFDDEDLAELRAMLLPATSATLLPLTGAPAGVTLN